MNRTNHTKDIAKRKNGIGIKTNGGLILFLALVILGVCVGAVTVNAIGTDNLAEIGFVAGSSIELRTNLGFLQTLSYTFTSEMVYILVLLFMAFCTFAMPVIFFLAAYKGFGMGVLAGYLYSAYGMKGFFYSLMFLIPKWIFCSILFCYAAREAARLSGNIFRLLFSKEEVAPFKKNMKMFGLKYAVYSSFIFAVSILQALITVIFVDVIKL